MIYILLRSRRRLQKMKMHHPGFYTKILLTIVLSFIIPLSILFFYSYSRMDNAITQKTERIALQEMEKTHQAVENLFYRISRTVEHISVDNRLNRLIQYYDNNISEPQTGRIQLAHSASLRKYDFFLWATEIQKILGIYSANWMDSPMEIGLIFNDGYLLSTWPSNHTDTEQLQQLIAHREVVNRISCFIGPHPSFVTHAANGDYFTYYKDLYDLSSPKDYLGTVVVTVPISEIQVSIMRNLNSNHYAFYLLDQDRQILLSENTDSFSLEKLLALYDASSNPADHRAKHGSAVFWDVFPIVETNWLLCHAIPEADFFPEIQHLRNLVIWSFLIILAVVSTVSFFIIFRLLSPIRRLTESMHEVEKGNIDIQPLIVTSHDEVGRILSGFNALMDQQRKLIRRVQETEKQKGELRFEMLLAQINPHFLFNTLNSLKWMAAIIHADNITNMICDLARLLEISMNKQADFIPIREELLNLRSYISIQAVRYGDTFDVNFDVDPALNEFETIKLLFQPIVENAIIHNMQDVPSLHIEIKGRLMENQTVEFTITDNGKGMNAEQLHQLFSLDRHNDHRVFRGIGVTNVQQRIQLRYGEKYGVAMQSAPGKGTCARITFPAVRARRDTLNAQDTRGIQND